MWSELRRTTLHEAAAWLRRRHLSARELARAQLDALRAAEPELRACTWRLAEADLDSVPDESPPLDASPLWGLGGAVKANIWVRDRETACGSRVLRGWRAPADAAAVARLRSRGAVPVAGTVMDEFGMGSSCEHAAEGPARNPWDGARTPGGSSGGSAALVAAGLAWWALGSDTGGSVRQPAHCCGLVGLKPTYGRVSRRGLVAYVSSCDQIGPLTREVRDAAVVYSALAGHDPGDATSLNRPVGDAVAACERPVRGLRVGVPRDLLTEGIEPAVLAEFEDVLDDLRSVGVEVCDVNLAAARQALAVYFIIACAEAAANLARFDGSLYGARRPGATYAAMIRATRTAGLGPEVKRRILLGTYVLSAGHRARTYERALARRRAITQAVIGVLADVDALALPTAPESAFLLGDRREDPVRMVAGDLLTVPANLTGLPALTVPTGLDPLGLPLSLQLIGRPLDEESLFALGAAVEAVRRFPFRPEAPWNR